MLTSCPSCLQGLSRFDDDAGTQADYIVVEMAKRILGPDWLPAYVARANCRRNRARARLVRPGAIKNPRGDDPVSRQAAPWGVEGNDRLHDRRG